MNDQELMPIGTFAALAGITASALRFYDDADLLHPQHVDPVSGYRFYSETQLVRATQLRQLRKIGMPLNKMREYFNTGSDDAARLINEHVTTTTKGAVAIRQTAARLKEYDVGRTFLTLCVLPGPVLAAAVDQVLAATTHEPEFPALTGVHVEVEADAISLTATDRYRLVTRTLVPSQPSTASWAGTLTAVDLQNATAKLRRSPTVTLEAGERTLRLRTSGGDVLYSHLLTEVFPDYRLLIESLPEVTNRVAINSHQLLRVLGQAPEKISLTIVDGQPRVMLPGAQVALNGTATGADLTLWFELTTLYPALSHALGTDIILDLRGADQPATVRSADIGDLTTLVMPCCANQREATPNRDDTATVSSTTPQTDRA